MAGNTSVAVEKVPYRVIQRWSRRQQMFYEDVDFQTYLDLLARFCHSAGTQVLAYCLLPDKVHLIMVPSRKGGLRGAASKAHRLYRRGIDFRRGPSKNFSQELLLTFQLKSDHLPETVRFIENEPVRANLAKTPGDYPWSSARAHLTGRDDMLVTVEPLLRRVPHWEDFLSQKDDARMVRRFKHQERKGRLVGSFGLTALMGKISGKKKRSAKSEFMREEQRK
jgi:putative transposase